MLSSLFKSIIDADSASVVVCSPEHIVVYMNPAAINNYAKRGGAELIGKSIFGCHNAQSNEMIDKVVNWFASSPEHNKVHTFFNEKQQKDVYMIALRDDEGRLIGYYEKHEFRKKDPSPFYLMD